MNKAIQLKKDEDTGETYLDLEDLKDLFDISKVEYYDLEEENGSLILRVYDKDKNLIKPNE
jgi:hypothetical protein